MMDDPRNASVEAAFCAACEADARLGHAVERGHPVLYAARRSFHAIEDPAESWSLREVGGGAVVSFGLGNTASLIAAVERLVRDGVVGRLPVPVDLDSLRWQVMLIELRAGDGEAHFLADTDALLLSVVDLETFERRELPVTPGMKLSDEALLALFSTQERLDRWVGRCLDALRREWNELGLRRARSLEDRRRGH
ncbi:hypothetical protein DWB68_09755 [Galactobacter valiniphilus]|uniref:Uncharacterized protein n=1 Tax=Galactobacter valiniphilus TaxID=2676122 RepID=A0A399JCG4_9MICC|nr:hypothetical protein [Galactobacter valiniphilus]RII41939.1 hypothetical protein DWB68_09755 [Galactobacter valiniphilus]